MNGSQLNQNIFLDDNASNKVFEKVNSSNEKKKSAYSSTKIKARNILTNLSYNRFGKQDFEKRSFIIDITTFIIQYFNLIGLDRKLETYEERKQVSFIWQKCLPADLMHFLTFRDNYVIISNQNLNFQKCYEIVCNYIERSEANFSELQRYIQTYFTEIRYVFAILFSKIYSRTDLNGIDTKSKFNFSFYEWQSGVHETTKQLAKDVNNYKNTDFSVERIENEQIPTVDLTTPTVKQEDDSTPVTKVPKTNTSKTPRQKFDSDRAKRRQEKRGAQKRQLEETLEENTKQLNLLKPASKMSRKLVIK